MSLVISANITEGAGTFQNNLVEEKRHSRSLDLGPNARMTLHQRSASVSDGIDFIAASEQPISPLTATAAVPTSRGETTSSSSVFSLYKKLSSPRRNRSITTTSNTKSFTSKSRASIGSAFSSFLQPSVLTITCSDMDKKSRFSSPVNNPDAAVAMSPINQSTIKEEEQVEIKKPNLLDQAGTSKRSLPSSLQQEINQFSIDGFAHKYFATHKRGLFRRTVPMTELLCWTKDSIRQPLLNNSKSLLSKDALKCFKTLQMLMNDRPQPRTFDYIENFQSLLSCGITKGQMRDEIYVQICRQLNKNPNDESIRKGWEILCVVSVTFPPSKNLETYLNRFVQQHFHQEKNQLDVLSQYVSAKLVRICSRGARGKVLSAAEIERAKEAPFKPSVFGESLDAIMDLQKDDTKLFIPKIVTFLTQSVHDLNGSTSEGIFRVPGDADSVTEMRIRIENGNYDSTGIDDPNVPASLLKYWLRDLAEPLIPTDLYDDCIKYAHDKEKANDIINSLPNVNRRIALYMIRFLQDFTDPQVIQHTRMNVVNLAMVFAPNFLRCPSVNLTTIFENSKYEQLFLKTLITNLDVEKQSCAYSEHEIMGRIKE
ncbi:Rho GTPase activation protein [Parasitella parasitica]|nr:Rho GTPase activation protein [Parasitella parasitica]